MFAMYAAEGNHHGAGRASVWCKATRANQSAMIDENPERFFMPPYVGPSGWIGIFLDRNVDWDEVAALMEDAYRLIAPRNLLAQLDNR